MWIALGLGIVGAILNRSRGSWFRTHVLDSGTLARLVWAVPTGFLMWYGLNTNYTFMENGLRVFLFILSAFAMWALLGSGAHSVINFEKWKEQWDSGNTPDDTEGYSKWILFKLYGGSPNPMWSNEDFETYHCLGKSIEGVLRMAIMVLPIIYLNPGLSGVLVLSGFTWGWLFYLGWQLDDDHGWAWGELFTGFITWGTIGVLLYA